MPGIIAAAVGALIFSAFHYIGPYGDKWQLASFTYRALAGLATASTPVPISRITSPT